MRLISLNSSHCSPHSVAKGLGLNRQSVTELPTFLADPALPFDLPIYAQEVPRRAFYMLLKFDTFFSCGNLSTKQRFHPYAFPDGE